MSENVYSGRYIQGRGDKKWLDLIDRSFGMLNSSPELPNMKMLYKSATDMFSEGFIWGNGWWMQNSYGFTLGAVPLLGPFWQRILQNSYDGFWKRIGDGKRIGYDDGIVRENDVRSLCAPDGCLGDCVTENAIVYRQGDGDWSSYDWFYEATAAGVVIETEILLFSRDTEQIGKYIPLMKRSLDFIEKTRAENGLFLVGPSCDLLAPSYGGSYDAKTDTVGKGYLTGVAVTYAAALRGFIELLKIAKETGMISEYQSRFDRCIEALPLLLTDEGYFCKSMDPDGTKHGVIGAEKYGYLSSVANVDAVASGIVDRAAAEKIYAAIAATPGIRPEGVICNNWPHLDDTINNYRTHSSAGNSFYFGSGDWVDGGCWGTVEGRAILTYLMLGKYDDAYKAAGWYMKWAEEYRMDAPLSQWGHNTNNPWQGENDDHTSCKQPVSVMVDNFASVTCLIRGLFEYRADADGLYIIPHVPDGIEEYIQNEPVWYAGHEIYIGYRSGGARPRASFTGRPAAVRDGAVFIPAKELCSLDKVYIRVDCSDEPLPMMFAPVSEKPSGDIRRLPEELKDIYRDCKKKSASAKDPLLAEQLRQIMLSCEAACARRRLPFDRHELRPMTEEKKEIITGAYDGAVKQLYQGLKYRDRG